MKYHTSHPVGFAGRMAFCGLAAALSVVFMMAGSWIPAATFCCPVLASLPVMAAQRSYGGQSALLCYAASAILSLLLAADKEAAMLFLCLGYWPAVKPRFDRIRRFWLRWGAKLAVLQAAILICYGTLLLVMTNAADLGFDGLGAVLWLMGNVTFILYDQVLTRLSKIYDRRFKK